MKDEWPCGSEQPFGVQIAHSWKEIGAILFLIDEFKVDTFIEIGTSRGGLSAFMLARCYFMSEFVYRGIEVDPDVISGRVMEFSQNLPNARIVVGNCFSEGIQEYIKHMVDLSKVAFLYCDGCNRPREFSEYMSIMRPGDIVALHGFPLDVTLSTIQPFVDDEKFVRVVRPCLDRTTLLVGTLI